MFQLYFFGVPHATAWLPCHMYFSEVHLTCSCSYLGAVAGILLCCVHMAACAQSPRAQSAHQGGPAEAASQRPGSCSVWAEGAVEEGRSCSAEAADVVQRPAVCCGAGQRARQAHWLECGLGRLVG